MPTPPSNPQLRTELTLIAATFLVVWGAMWVWGLVKTVAG